MRNVVIGRIMGIEVELHSTFILFIALILLGLLLFSPGEVFSFLLWTTILFSSVLAHEFFHALAAKRLNIPVRRVTLLPIGGVAQMEITVLPPKKELFLAISGPLFNIGVVILTGALMLMGYSGPLVSAAFQINLVLGLFNLLVPAIPMDGGRIFRALLSMKLGYYRATEVATKLSVWIALLMFLVGISVRSLWILAFIAFFVYFGALSERETASVYAYLGDVPVSRAARSVPVFVNFSDREILDYLRSRLLPAALILEGGEIRVYIPGVGRVRTPVFTGNESAARVFLFMHARGLPLVPVINNGIRGVYLHDLETLLALRRVPG